MTQSHISTKRLAILGMFAALAFGIYALESLIPNPIPIPGIKLGLANIISLVVLKKYGLRDSCLVLTVRLLLSALLFGSLMSLIYSAVGGFLCILGEYLINRFLRGQYLPVTAIFGAILHNAGQIAVAMIITGTFGVIIYAPYLAIAAVITGLITGFLAVLVLKLIPESLFI